MRTHLAFAAALCLLGCAELRWEKSGADAEATTQDLDSCRAQARAGLARTTTMAPPTAIVITPPGFDPVTGRFISAPSAIVSGPSAAATAIDEEDATNRCMRGKGYHVVPVQK